MGEMWAFTTGPATHPTLRMLIYTPDRVVCNARRSQMVAKWASNGISDLGQDCRQVVIGAGADYYVFRQYFSAEIVIPGAGGASSREWCDVVRRDTAASPGTWAVSRCEPIGVMWK